MSAEKFVSSLLARHPPGRYLLLRGGDPESIADKYFKMDREKYLAMLRHDYTVALLRRSGEDLGRVKEAYRLLNSWLDWGEPPWSSLDKKTEGGRNLKAAEDEVKKWAEEAAETLFNIYREEIEVEGWRDRPGETIWDGVQRGLLTGGETPFRKEWERWTELEMQLKKMVWDENLRTKDRVGLWFARKLLEHVRIFQYSKQHIPVPETVWPEEVLRWIIEGEYDSWVDLSYLYIDAAFMEIHDKIRLKIPGPYLVEDLIIMAAMAVEGVDPRGHSLSDLQRYLEDFARRVEDEELIELYRTARGGSTNFKIYESMFLEPDKIPEEQRKILKKMEEASNDFIVYTVQYIWDIAFERMMKKKT